MSDVVYRDGTNQWHDSDKCSRCGNPAEQVALVWQVRAGGHSLPTLSQPHFEPPRTERVCADCLEPREIALHPDIGCLIVLALNELQSNAQPESMVAIEHVKTFFMVRNNGTPTDVRAKLVAMKIMGAK